MIGIVSRAASDPRSGMNDRLELDVSSTPASQSPMYCVIDTEALVAEPLGSAACESRAAWGKDAR